MGFFGKLFGSDRVIEKAVDGVYNGVDKLVYTDEEKKDNYLRVMQMYTAFKVAQRYLSLIFGTPYAAAWFITFVASFFVEVESQVALLNGTMGNIVLAIVGFYFLGGAAEGSVKAVNWLKNKAG